MARSKPPAAALHASPDDVEAQFYEALARADIGLLMSVWADDDEIVCVHPAGARLIGPAAIRAGFEAIFAGGAIPVRIDHVRRLNALGSAVHHLVECISVPGEGGAVQHAFVLATNVYLKTAQGWRLAAHHSSPASAEEPSDASDVPSTLH